MAACARVAVLLLIAGLTNAAPPSLSLSLASSDTLFQGDYAVLLIQVTNLPANVTLWPAVDGLLWGAQTTLTQNISTAPTTITLRLPLPDAGTVAVQVAALPAGALSPSTYPTGQPMPSAATALATSNVLNVSVNAYVPPSPAVRTPTLVGMEWEPWFTPHNLVWTIAEAVPDVGFYNSTYVKVMQQHSLWLVTAGVDFIMVDWTNNLWSLPHWADRGVYAQELINATTATLEAYKAMRAQGLKTPAVVLLLGLDNGPSEPLACLQEEIDWITENYIPAYGDLLQTLDGRPLLVAIDGGHSFTPADHPLNTTAWTFRWMASQLQNDPAAAKDGYWSWMDGVMEPIPTPLPTPPPSPLPNIHNEALTTTCAYFSDGGWLAPKARGKRQGATWLQQMAYATTVRPQVLLVNQWNEYAGQAEGSTTEYVDIYNSTLGNDMEPTSLTECAYRRPDDRRCGGWGTYYLNALRATVDIYHGRDNSSTLLAVAQPIVDSNITVPHLTVEWYTMGVTVSSVDVAVNGKVVSRIAESPATVDLSAFSGQRGIHVITVTAVDGVSRYNLSNIVVDKPGAAQPSVVTLPVLFSF